MGRRREKMKTCEYLCYLQSKHTHFFPRWVRLSLNYSLSNKDFACLPSAAPTNFSDTLGGGNNRIPHMCKHGFTSANVPFYTFHSPFYQREVGGVRILVSVRTISSHPRMSKQFISGS